MDDRNASREDKMAGMKEAISYQSRLRLEATAGFGCDRHMLGLLCAAREMGRDIPEVFNDKVGLDVTSLCYHSELTPPQNKDSLSSSKIGISRFS